MARRARAEKRRLQALLASMAREELSPQKHVSQLREELMRIHETDRFSECETMGELTKAHIEYMLYEPDFTYRGKRTFMG